MTRLRRPTLTHAFERALDDARRDGLPLGEGDAAGDQAEEAVQKFQSTLEALPELSGGKYVATRSLAAAYRAESEQAAQARMQPQPQARPQPQRQTPETPAGKAAEERPPPSKKPEPAKRPERIKLRPGLGAQDLKRLRRQFALDNHPDRVPAEMREEAARVMAEANAVIDKALKRAKGD